MMKPHIEQRQKTILGLKTKPTLKYVALGLSFAIVGCFTLFMFQMGSNKNAEANTHKKFHFFLFPQKPKGEIAPAAEVEISSSGDSLYIDFISVDENEIRSAVLNIRDFNSSEENASLVKTFTIQSAQKISPNQYRFCVNANSIPKKVLLEVKVSMLNAKKIEPAVETMVNRICIDRNNFSVFATPCGLKANNVSEKNAVAFWQPVNDAFKYRVRCRETGSSEWQSGIIFAPSNQRSFANLKPATTYEFQVQAYTKTDKIDSTGYSPLISFTTIASPVK